MKITIKQLDKIIESTIREVRKEQSLLKIVRKKLQSFLKSLSPPEQEIIVRTFRKKSVKELLAFCGEANDLISGKADDQEFDRKLKLAKHNKQKQNSI